MKESKLIELMNKVETLGRVVQNIHIELNQLKDLSIGTMELVKKFEGYDNALEALKESIKEKQEDGDI